MLIVRHGVLVGMLAGLFVWGLAVGARADDGPTKTTAVRTSAGVKHLLVDQPNARKSKAWRGRAAQQTVAAREALNDDGDLRLTNGVIVRVERTDDLAALAGGRNVTPVLPKLGYWRVETDTVGEAIELADALAVERDALLSAVDVEWPWVTREVPSDPYLDEQWHLINTTDPQFDVNADAAWNLGYSGAGVVLGVVELAWQNTHPDLAGNYNEDASIVRSGSPSSHATRVAGVAAAVGNNDVMGAGVAYGADLSILMYGNESETASALGQKNNLNDIKSNSWGPTDNGQLAEMAETIREAIEDGVTSGRDGRGVIYVWAAGNGGLYSDRVDYDPFASSRYTIAVSSIGDADMVTSYDEPGCAVLAVTQSNGNGRGIATTTTTSSWTTSFGGTSAAAPLAAGVVALMLEANPQLTWRDVQHILLETTRKNDVDHADWATNGAGYEVNYYYGFGAIDAGAAVLAAEDWRRVPHEIAVDTGVIAVDPNVALIPDNDPVGVTQSVVVADDITIESVELILNASSTFIGDLDIELTAPSGMVSTFSEKRGDSQEDLVGVTFTSLRHWGEGSAGEWSVRIADRASQDRTTWQDYQLVFHGTPACPGDLSANGTIDIDDVTDILAVYGTYEGDAAFDPAADLNNNGCIDLADLQVVLAYYGSVCP